MSRKKQRGKSKNKCKTLNMPYTVTFLDQKLYQSLSFDADMKFTDASEYAKKVWVLKEYKKAGGDLDLTERGGEKTFSKKIHLFLFRKDSLYFNSRLKCSTVLKFNTLNNKL